MSAILFTCPMCGHSFDGTEHAACQSCPIHKGCAMVCCPKCGYNTINPGQSKLVRLVTQVFRPGTVSRSKNNNPAGIVEAPHGLTLAEVPPGRQAQVVGFSSELTAERRARLQAYGLIQKNQVRVVQHSPVTVIRVDHTELALERELAGEIRVVLMDKEK